MLVYVGSFQTLAGRASLSATWAQTFQVDETRLLQWAFAKTVLSIARRIAPVLEMDAELDLLAILRTAASGWPRCPGSSPVRGHASPKAPPPALINRPFRVKL